MSEATGVVLAGIPAENPALYHRVRFGVGDPAAWLQIDSAGNSRTEFIVRDIELERARQQVAVDRVSCPAEYAPSEGLSGDRTTATAQALAECLRRAEVARVKCDRSLPFVYAWHLMQARIELEYSPDLGVMDRRVKEDEELEYLTRAQRVTEDAMLMACQIVGRATADQQGHLQHAGERLTSERLRRLISSYLLDRGFTTPHDSIVATRPHSADCHERGSGALVTGQAVIIDIFPQDSETRYWGDCTRTVVHGETSDEILKMHAAVLAAKQAATNIARAGVPAESVHAAAVEQIVASGYAFARGQIADQPVMPHGTGHGIGLEVHEPILLDEKGGSLLAGEVFTIEPGLYSRLHGGVRVEDMVVIAADGPPRSLNQLPHGLDWK